MGSHSERVATAAEPRIHPAAKRLAAPKNKTPAAGRPSAKRRASAKPVHQCTASAAMADLAGLMKWTTTNRTVVQARATVRGSDQRRIPSTTPRKTISSTTETTAAVGTMRRSPDQRAPGRASDQPASKQSNATAATKVTESARPAARSETDLGFRLRCRSEGRCRPIQRKAGTSRTKALTCRQRERTR